MMPNYYPKKARSILSDIFHIILRGIENGPKDVRGNVVDFVE